eukprot:COSAG02_NODE_3_length_74588_cov_108.368430_8_plen_197_part_00
MRRVVQIHTNKTRCIQFNTLLAVYCTKRVNKPIATLGKNSCAHHLGPCLNQERRAVNRPLLGRHSLGASRTMALLRAGACGALLLALCGGVEGQCTAPSGDSDCPAVRSPVRSLVPLLGTAAAAGAIAPASLLRLSPWDSSSWPIARPPSYACPLGWHSSSSSRDDSPASLLRSSPWHRVLPPPNALSVCSGKRRG